MLLCNICETKLMAGNICPVCKRICRTPIVIPDSIRLNSSHTEEDGGCSYHAGERAEPLLNASHPVSEENCSYHGSDWKRPVLNEAYGQERGSAQQKSGPSAIWTVVAIVVILNTAAAICKFLAVFD